MNTRQILTLCGIFAAACSAASAADAYCKNMTYDSAGTSASDVGSTTGGAGAFTFLMGGQPNVTYQDWTPDQADIYEPKGCWLLAKWDLSGLTGASLGGLNAGLPALATSDATIDVEALAGVSDLARLRMFEMPANAMKGSARVSPGTPTGTSPPWYDQTGFGSGFAHTSYNSLKANGLTLPKWSQPVSDVPLTYLGEATWRPDPAGGGMIASWSIPRAIVNRWLTQPATYNGVIIAPANQSRATLGVGKAYSGNQLDHGGGFLRFTFSNGDVNGDCKLTAADIDAMQAAGFGACATGAPADINGDGLVDGRDVDEFLSTFAHTVRGDANLDGVVNGADFLIWQRGCGKTTYSAGDFNTDGVVNGADFLLWQNAYGTRAASASTTGAPEPSVLAMIAASAIAALLRRNNT